MCGKENHMRRVRIDPQKKAAPDAANIRDGRPEGQIKYRPHYTGEGGDCQAISRAFLEEQLTEEVAGNGVYIAL